MNYPIPRPKSISFLGSEIPATIEFDNTFDAFVPAVKVFQEYTRRIFSSINNDSDKIELYHKDGLGDGYQISIKSKVVIKASTVCGVNYALSTLLQLMIKTENGVSFPKCEIIDTPDSEWRGVIIDLARCFHEIEYLYATADLCWFYKMNRFQLHLTDDQAIRFPFSSLRDAVSEDHCSCE